MRTVKLTIELDLTYDGMSGVHRRDIIAAVDDYLEGSFQESLKKGLGALATPARIGLRIRSSEGKMGGRMKGPRYPLELTAAEYHYVRAYVEAEHEIGMTNRSSDKLVAGLLDKLRRAWSAGSSRRRSRR
jgi:hypothetical protein